MYKVIPFKRAITQLDQKKFKIDYNVKKIIPLTPQKRGLYALNSSGLFFLDCLEPEENYDTGFVFLTVFSTFDNFHRLLTPL